jgi:hypothetical protein
MAVVQMRSQVTRRAARRTEVDRELTIPLQLDGFARTALEEECARQGVAADELARFAVLYYLADLDSGRVAREVPPPQARPSARER